MANRSMAALKAWRTRRTMSTFAKARAAEAASKAALKVHCEANGWRVAFFEGPTGAPRTGIIDAVAFRLGPRKADLIDIRLVQLKGGNAGVTGREIARLKEAVAQARARWIIAPVDREAVAT